MITAASDPITQRCKRRARRQARRNGRGLGYHSGTPVHSFLTANASLAA